ncbi:uncharacterized protein LOC103314313 [Tribolium castaneum]|uniref:Uncharacterized protein n=1 Tax=Tribolium castaneum TaxID=7070 RepID=D6WZI6_TRICA|nr:PREDICTED: uncharacterized protein LOC103314313 [Tribolium castaneum]EFA09699.1 hypothetical protein TcasGA2_TC011831 [Tribolium castaneum]|eukprot:XP_008198230.1 PREDICTED: uncharacterized protein LOC103314313 [Tribolium castaneum]
MNESNSRELQRAQTHLRTLFRAFVQVSESSLNRKNQQLLDDLDKLEFGAPLPELAQFAGELPELPSVDPTELRSEMVKALQLLQVLKNKADCPISRIVDEV